MNIQIDDRIMNPSAFLDDGLTAIALSRKTRIIPSLSLQDMMFKNSDADAIQIKPELKSPVTELSAKNLMPLATEIKNELSSTEHYTGINENNFAAMYAQLLALFAKLNESSSKLTGVHAELVGKMAKESGENMVSAAAAQRNQAITSAATSIAIGGVGMALSHKGFNEQQNAFKQEKLSKKLRIENEDVGNSLTNTTNLNTAASQNSVTNRVNLNNSASSNSVPNGANVNTAASQNSVTNGTNVNTTASQNSVTNETNVNTTTSQNPVINDTDVNNVVSQNNPEGRAFSDSYIPKREPIPVRTTKQAEVWKLAGNKKTNTGQAITNISQVTGNMVSSDYMVISATDNARAQLANTLKDAMAETEIKNRENQTSVRNNLKQLLDVIYQALEKNNEAISHTAQMLKV